MDEFKKKLTSLRMGAKNVAKGTLANMKKGWDGTAQREMDQHIQDRDNAMIRENFGSEENYRKMLDNQTQQERDLFTPPYQKAGKAIGKAAKGAKGLFDRLVSVRGGGK